MPRKKSEKKSEKKEYKQNIHYIIENEQHEYTKELNSLINLMEKGDKYIIFENEKIRIELVKLFSKKAELCYYSLDIKLLYPNSKAFYRNPLFFGSKEQFLSFNYIYNEKIHYIESLINIIEEINKPVRLFYEQKKLEAKNKKDDKNE